MNKHYKAYKEDQASKFSKDDNRYSGKFSIDKTLPRYKRKENFISLIIDKTGLKPANEPSAEDVGRTAPEIFEIGVANPEALQIWQEKGFEAVGFDLYSHWEEIQQADMHSLPLMDQSADLIVFSHSLEHAFSFPEALFEADRVLKPYGFIAIEVPIRFMPNKHDRFDFYGAQRLMAYININSIDKNYEYVYAKNYKKSEEGNFCYGQMARVIMQKR